MAGVKIKDLTQNTLEFLNSRRRAYGLVFRDNTEPSRVVMKDLTEFTHWIEGPAGATNEETWRLIGRQDVLRRIMQHANLSDRQLMALYNGGRVPILESDTET